MKKDKYWSQIEWLRYDCEDVPKQHFQAEKINSFQEGWSTFHS